jgi:superfamily II DNA/RNA helicase
VNGDTYVHRAGRTARANRKGEALILVDKREANRWSEINDIIADTTPNRKVNKYQPVQVQIEEIA